MHDDGEKPTFLAPVKPFFALTSSNRIPVSGLYANAIEDSSVGLRVKLDQGPSITLSSLFPSSPWTQRNLKCGRAELTYSKHSFQLLSDDKPFTEYAR